VLGLTCRAHALRPCIFAPGRVEHVWSLHLPDQQSRLDILKVHAEQLRLGPLVEERQDGVTENSPDSCASQVSKLELLQYVSTRTAGYVGADISQVCWHTLYFIRAC
jgi:SpoVK/Ycf46/Vps4 family AAA+-type ATPase